MPASFPSASGGAISGVSALNAGVWSVLPRARTNSTAATAVTERSPRSDPKTSVRLTAAMKRSAPIMSRLMDVRSTMVPAKAPRSAMGKKAARLTNDRALAEPVVRVTCQMRPICKMELVSTEKNSPIQTMASERFQEARGFGCVME